MGSYSYFSHGNIEVTDAEGLKNFVKTFKEAFPNEAELLNIVSIDGDKVSVDFVEWDGHKLISYWYPITVCILHCIANYISGYARFNFETDDECAEFLFEDKKCKINIGMMEYSVNSTIELFDDGEVIQGKDSTKKIREFMLTYSF